MELLNDIQAKNILVIGDVMLDTYYSGDVKRISPEAPVPVFKKESESSVPGGAANVIANLIAAGQNVSVMTMIGQDRAGEKLKNMFEKQNVNTDLMTVLDRPTTEKIRFLASNHQQVMRLDVEDIDLLPSQECAALLDKLENYIDKFDLILLSDYMKGLLTYDLTQSILKKAKSKGIPAIIDVKDPNVKKYKDAYLLKPNLKELQELSGMSVSDDKAIIEASKYLKEICDCQYVLTTCGGRGMVLVGNGEPYFVEAKGQEVFDVTGAGDTTIAYLAACMVNGFSMKDAVDIANLAAGIQVSKVGTSSVRWKEIRKKLSGNDDGFLHKLISGKIVDTFRTDHEGQKVVFTNGCFDILHIGHIRYMQEAARLGDILVIGLNSDASVRRLKGPERPVNGEQDRAELLCALGFVDYVTIFDEDTPWELIRKIQPDVLVKGGDYKPDEVVGRDIVEDRSGELVLIPLVEGKSTTGLLDKIQRSNSTE